jgi:hypothetical protein
LVPIAVTIRRTIIRTGPGCQLKDEPTHDQTGQRISIVSGPGFDGSVRRRHGPSDLNIMKILDF